MTRITVQTEPRPYDVLIETGLLQRAGVCIAQALGRRVRVMVVTARPVRKAWGAALGKSLKAAGLEHQIIEMGDGEREKNLSTIEKLAHKMVQHGADRGTVVLAFGGGVVGDVAGLLASLYMRGVDVVQAPTTFLAQVDAAIGGKTGVNLKSGKNLVGTFHQPRAVLIDPRLLGTLPEREYRAGLYEALKCGVIRDAEIFRFMEEQRESILRRETPALEWLIASCVRVKAEVVAADEREGGLRRILNFGHTIGHALEAETAYRRFLHGEAVAWGMVAAAKIAAAVRKTDAETAQRITALVLAYGRLPKVEPAARRIARRLVADKKTRDGVVHFVLPTTIGSVAVTPDVPERAVVQAIEEVRKLSRA